NSGSNNVSVLEGNGNGTFSAATNFATGASPQWVAVGDFDRAGKPDIVAVNGSSANVAVLVNISACTKNCGTMGDPGGVNVGGAMVLADMNRDGKLDLVAAKAQQGGIVVVQGNGDGTFGGASTNTTGTNTAPAGVAVGDLNRDGKLDVATGNSSNGDVSILLGA